jgi:uncharacterized protein
MSYFFVTYEYTGDPQAQHAVRPAHRDFLAGLGPTLVVSGPTDSRGAALVFEAAGAGDVETLLDEDPFWKQGFVASRTVVGWTPVLGRLVETGVLP